jgi:O-antigen/teichoic acid export membrane protein
MDENNRKIVKNSAYLYIRMMVTMVLGFVVTRIVLEKLGASDYGVYNVVGGFVSLFTVLNSILQGGTRRFLALRIGEGDCSKLKDTFSTAFVIHLGIAIIVFILLETIGLYFVNHKLNIDQERLSAANWVFQCSIVSVVMAITQTPFTAAVTAHEHFNIYAFMSIFDIVGRIIMLLLLTFIPGDKLIIYALIQMLIGLIVMVVYRWYCFMHFQECAFSLRIDKLSFREMIQFSGWSTIGHLSAVLNGQGMSILINPKFRSILV